MANLAANSAEHAETTDLPEPLIVTLEMDPASFQRLDALRCRYFPAERNFIPAHLTLFHHLPGDRLTSILPVLERVCRNQVPFRVEAARLRMLGRGVAIDLVSPELSALRGHLADGWAAWMTRQDLQPWRPHVTLQNKVAPAEAQRLYAELSRSLILFAVEARGLLLWRYLGGPWKALGTYTFAGA